MPYEEISAAKLRLSACRGAGYQMNQEYLMRRKGKYMIELILTGTPEKIQILKSLFYGLNESPAPVQTQTALPQGENGEPTLRLERP